MTQPDRGFGADRLLIILKRLPQATKYLIGFSGGADSTALLTALHELGPEQSAPVEALHFNHQLQPQADVWQAHCERFCNERGIEFRTRRLDLPSQTGRSQELAARKARYRIVTRLLGPGEVYLTAHHQDDQAETLFINLMRGSGMDGIASIPPARRLGAGWVARPLLEFRHYELESFLTDRGLDWIEDSSNRDTAFDRNFIRHQVLPLLDARWAGAVPRLARTARQARDTMNAFNTDLERRYGHWILDSHTFSADTLPQLPRVFQAMLIRLWIRKRGLIPPPAKRLDEFLDQFADSEKTRSGVELRWDGWQIKRHQDRLWLHPFPFPSICPEQIWCGMTSIELDDRFGVLRIAGPMPFPEPMQVRAREAGTSIRLHADGPRRKVKALMREHGIPPWLRRAVPVLYLAEEPMAIGDWALSSTWRAWLSETSATYSWLPRDPLLRKLRDDCNESRSD